MLNDVHSQLNPTPVARIERPRSLADRLAGSRRLWRFHAIIVALMAVGTGLAVVFA